ncbi:MAG: restriction endonuclease subunit S [Arcobacter sp.]|jgi:type I restriction enzyme S subunit|uniref:restriction endonuclease subunit S n=1 Tax=Arcobacter sp. TaxID=1872629 RepID=UPI002A75033D|nr:restriction endonuclease subunit S [Arcobacter sp.]MDY3199388.1 restriction endonuclease subunit S [Arcobacter sp.]
MINNLPNGWKLENISDIFKLKQGNHLSMNDLEEDGYFVYGANGIIGKYHKYMYEDSKVLITCRGATCGTINISKPKSWITGNAIALTEKKDYIDENYIAYFLRKDKLQSVISGSAQSQITATNLSKLKIPIPPLQQQEKIVKVLDLTSNLIEKQKELLEKYDLFLKSKFIEMFGDPISNPMGWEIVKCIDVADCIVPGRDKPKSFTGNIPWITTADLRDKGIISKSKENIGLSQNEIKEVRAKLIPKNSVIFTCVGDLGICSITTENIIMNQQLHSFQCKENVNNIFLMFNITMQKSYMYKMATSTTVPYMNKTTCNNIPTILPPLELQNKFASIVEKIEIIKEKENQKLKQLENLHNSMMNKAFKGDIK